MTSAPLQGKTIAFAVANEGIEQVELEQPWDAVKAAGGTPVLVSSEPGSVQAFNHLDKGDMFDVDTTFADASPADFDGLVLLGGVANPDALRTNDDAVRFVQAFVGGGKAGRGHLSRALDAGRGRRARRAPPDLVAEPADRHPQRRRHLGRRGGRHGPWLVTSRKPDDLPAFIREMVSHFAGAVG